MNRSLFPEGVEVHQRHLSNTEATKSAAITQLAGDATSLGVASGLVVSVNTPDTTRVAISAGYGYAPNGELLRLNTNINNIALADYTLNINNYVLLMYDETPAQPEAHETDGTTRNTVTTVTPRVAVLSESQYTALASSDPVLSNNARDRALVLAVVTAAGPAVSLTSSLIKNATIFQPVLKVTQPSNISGVVVSVADPLTQTGVGTITWVAGSKTLQWTAPGDTAGPAVSITSAGIYNIVSHNGRYLNLQVEYSLLPVLNATDSISIDNLYAQRVPRLTSDDLLHRSMVGSGTPTARNPHGLTVLDLDPGALNTVAQHQEQMHANGIAAGSSATVLLPQVVVATSPDQLLVNGFLAGDSVYINGSQVQDLVGSPAITFTDGTAAQAMYAIFISHGGALAKYVRATFPPAISTFLTNKIQIVSASSSIGTTTKNLTWSSSGTISFDGGVAKQAPATDQQLRLYGGDGLIWIDVYVRGGATPGTDQTDPITFTALPDLVQNFYLADVVWSGNTTGFLGAGFGTGSSPNFITDRRLFGTIAPSNVRSDFGYNNAQNQAADSIGDGVALQLDLQTTHSQAAASQLSLGTAASGSVKLSGGVAYVGGRRFNVPTTVLTVAAATTNRIYLDHTGTPQISVATWQTISDLQYDKPFVKLYDLVMTGATDGGHTDNRVFINAKHDQPFGVVGLDVNKAAIITSTSGAALTATGGNDANTSWGVHGTGGTGGGGAPGGRFDGGGTNGWGVDARGQGTGGGVYGQGGSSGGAGGQFMGGAGANAAVYGIGAGSTVGSVNGKVGGYFIANASVGGDGVQGVALGSGRSGVQGTGGTGGAGGFFVGGTGSGRGVYALGNSNGTGGYFDSGSGNAWGVEGHGSGTGGGIYGAGGTWAGYFQGNVNVTGTLSSSSVSTGNVSASYDITSNRMYSNYIHSYGDLDAAGNISAGNAVYAYGANITNYINCAIVNSGRLVASGAGYYIPLNIGGAVGVGGYGRIGNGDFWVGDYSQGDFGSSRWRFWVCLGDTVYGIGPLGGGITTDSNTANGYGINLRVRSRV